MRAFDAARAAAEMLLEMVAVLLGTSAIADFEESASDDGWPSRSMTLRRAGGAVDDSIVSDSIFS